MGIMLQYAKHVTFDISLNIIHNKIPIQNLTTQISHPYLMENSLPMKKTKISAIDYNNKSFDLAELQTILSRLEWTCTPSIDKYHNNSAHLEEYIAASTSQILKKEAYQIGQNSIEEIDLLLP